MSEGFVGGTTSGTTSETASGTTGGLDVSGAGSLREKKLALLALLLLVPAPSMGVMLAMVIDSTQDSSITTTTTADSNLYAGIALETIADTASGRFIRIGLVAVTFTGAGSRGDFAFTSTVSGKAKASATYSTAAFGILTTDVAAGSATVMVGSI